jgi:nucleoside-diphosphate-sugar epimerase
MLIDTPRNESACSVTPTLVIGCGYLGKTVADAIRRDNPEGIVYATTRNLAKADRLAKAGICPIICDWTDRRSLSALPRCKKVLVAVSYDRRSGQNREESQVGGLSNLLDFVDHDADLCYISTTGVYHQTGGQWVDENSPARPLAEGGKAHLRAEELLQRRRPAGCGTILRLAGIYGPDRVPRAADVIAGRSIDGPHGGFLNLIHVSDAAEAVLASWRTPLKNRLYVVADDVPVIRRTFYEEIARLAGVSKPYFTTETTQSSAAVLSARSGNNKRIWNRRFRRDLMLRLNFPSYVEGLAALDLRTN